MRIVILVVIFLLFCFSGYFVYRTFTVVEPKNYEECIKVPNAKILMSYPANCVSSSGKYFTQPLTDEEKKKLIPPPNEVDWKTVTGTDENGKAIYTIKIPSDWKEIEHSSNFYNIQTFEASDKSSFEITFQYAQGKNLDVFLSDSDLASKTGFEGKPTKLILSSKNTFFGGYTGIEREENLIPAGFKILTTYSLINSSQIFSFTVKPNSELNPRKTNVYKNYGQILDTFKYILESRGSEIIPCFTLNKTQCSERPDCHPDYLPNLGNNFSCSSK